MFSDNSHIAPFANSLQIISKMFAASFNFHLKVLYLYFQICEKLDKSVSRVDLKEDLQSLMKERGTGPPQPHQILFDCYVNKSFLFLSFVVCFWLVKIWKYTMVPKQKKRIVINLIKQYENCKSVNMANCSLNHNNCLEKQNKNYCINKIFNNSKAASGANKENFCNMNQKLVSVCQFLSLFFFCI